MERCPNCAARYTASPSCRRCGMDLEGLAAAERAAERLLSRGIGELLADRSEAAAEDLARSLALRSAPLTRHLLQFASQRHRDSAQQRTTAAQMAREAHDESLDHRRPGEHEVDTTFWLERWRQRQTGWHLDEINAHLQEHWPTLGVAPGTPVFVPLCGKTLDLIWLVSQGHPVIGVEISDIAVESFFAEHRLTPEITEIPPFRRYRFEEMTLLCGDFFALSPELVADAGAIFDRASLIALPPPMRERYAAHLDQLFPRPLDSLLITLDYDQTQMSGPPFSVQHAEVERLYASTHRIEALASIDALDDSPNFRARGLTALSERVYWLTPRL